MYTLADYSVIELIRRLRTLSGKLASSHAARPASQDTMPTKEQWHAALERAEVDLAELSGSVGVENARLIVRWLKKRPGRLRLNSIHNMLDDIVAVLECVGDRPLDEALMTLPREELSPQRCKDVQGRYYSTLRSLFYFATQTKLWRDLPLSLRHKQSVLLALQNTLTSPDLGRLIDLVIEQTRKLEQYPCTRVKVGRFLVALLLICSLAGLRIREALQLQLGDMWITDRLTVFVRQGKGGKSRAVERSADIGQSPAWALDWLRTIWLQRFDEEQRNLKAPFFAGRFFTTPTGEPDGSLDAVYQRVLRFLKSVGFEEGTHIFRRFLANSMRASSVPLINIVNLLGHSTIGTAPQNYLQVYPSLQRQQLREWLSVQAQIKIESRLTLAKFAEAQGISREGAYKLLMETQNGGQLQHDGRRTTPVSMEEAIAILKHRIRKAIASQRDADARQDKK